MHGPREVLNELKWTGAGFDGVEVHFVHRGAPGDTKVVPAADIVELGASFFTLRDGARQSSIPYHRVLLVKRRGERVWERRRA